MDIITNKIALTIRSTGMSQEKEANLVSLIEAYATAEYERGRQTGYSKGYDEGIAVANSDWP